MKTRINDSIQQHQVYPCSYTSIHIVDWKKFTSENLKVHDRVPVNPNTGKLIHSVCLRNDSAMSIIVDAFGENALQYSKKKKARQCECVIYPDNYKDTDWVLFVEMKYAENEIAAFRKGNDYPNNMIEQIKQTVQFFKDKCILPQEKEVYAIVSFPNLLSAFNSTIFSIDAINDFYLDYGIIIRGTNNAEIISSDNIKLIG